MNKRQRKKWGKIISQRLKFIGPHTLYRVGRKNGKSTALKAVFRRRYRPFKDLKRYLEGVKVF